MLRSIVCPICGAIFETSKPNKKYCSLSCKEAGHQLKRMNWDDKNEGYIKKYMREYRAAKKTSEEAKENKK